MLKLNLAAGSIASLIGCRQGRRAVGAIKGRSVSASRRHSRNRAIEEKVAIRTAINEAARVSRAVERGREVSVLVRRVNRGCAGPVVGLRSDAKDQRSAHARL